MTPGVLVRFTRWQALRWDREPPPFRVVDVRGEGDTTEIYDGERWGPAKHFEIVEEHQ